MDTSENHNRALADETKQDLKDFGLYFSNQFVTQFYSQLSQKPDTKVFLERLTPEEFEHLKSRQAEHVLHLTDPDMGSAQLSKASKSVGKVHGMVGLTVSILSRAYQLQTKIIIEGVSRYFRHRPQRDRVRTFMYQRILEDLVDQMSAMQGIGQQQEYVLSNITQVIHEMDPMSDILGSVITEISSLYGMQAVVLTRPDSNGRFQIERYSGALVERFLDHQSGGLALDLNVETLPEKGSMAQAWATGTMFLVDNYALRNLPEAWRLVFQSERVRSGAVLPLIDAEGETHALLQMYHEIPGYFSGPERETFLLRLQEVLHTIVVQSVKNQPIISQRQRQTYRHLLEENGLVMYYQPIVNLKTRAIHKMEALARLREPGGKVIPPNEFLPTFGHRELLSLFTKGLYQALRDLHGWHAYASLGISVNLPPAGIGQGTYMREIKRLLAATRTDPARLTLELLETEDSTTNTLAQGIAELKGSGIHLAQDDLGSGYSSLMRMGRVTFDEIKIDQGLVRNLTFGPQKALGFIHHLTSLGHDFDTVVTVEGVEHAGLLEAAAILGADYAQGYWISRPMPEEDVIPWMKQYQLDLDINGPKTALGAFAANILWHSQLRALAPLPDSLSHFLQTRCGLAQYIETKGMKGTSLHHIHDMMHVVALKGTNDPQYHRIKKDMERVLTEYVALEGAEGLGR